MIREWLRIAVGIGLIVAGVWGITDFTVPQPWADIARAVAVIVLALYHRAAGRAESNRENNW